MGVVVTNMPDHKNQHFVPRAHLKPFSVDGRGKAINLHRIGAGAHVFGAPVKSQCARPYLYGADGSLERILSGTEGLYATVVRRLSNPDARLNDQDRDVLRYFILLQSLRTAEQIERGLAQAQTMAAHFRRAHELHGGSWDAADDPTFEGAMQMLIETFQDQLRIRVIDDLKVLIVRNRTDRDFVTSDDPAVTTNRWLIQRKGIRVFGTNSAGLMLILPLGPRLLAMCYDPRVYTVSSSVAGGFTDLRRATDVLAFNQQQFMRAAEVLYYSRRSEADAVAIDYEATKPHRPARWESFNVARREGGSDTHERYMVGSSEEVAASDDQIFHMARETPSPPSWPSILRFRHDAHGFTKGRTIVRRSVVERDLMRIHQYRQIS